MAEETTQKRIEDMFANLIEVRERLSSTEDLMEVAGRERARIKKLVGCKFGSLREYNEVLTAYENPTKSE